MTREELTAKLVQCRGIPLDVEPILAHRDRMQHALEVAQKAIDSLLHWKYGAEPKVDEMPVFDADLWCASGLIGQVLRGKA